MQAIWKPWDPPRGVLGEILRETVPRVRALEERSADLAQRAGRASAAPSFASALHGESVAVIAEVKRRSPSKGTINASLAASERAAQYERGGAAALSVLTERERFGGSEEDLAAVHARVTLPLLRKDFHIHPLQLVEARALGAAAVLLIARALSPFDLLRLAQAAGDLGLEVMVEVRSEEELEWALRTRAPVIGVNNRDLETLAVDAGTAERLIPLVPADRVAVAESGVAARSDVERAARVGADAVLVGSSLSAASDPAAAVHALTGVARVRRGG